METKHILLLFALLMSTLICRAQANIDLPKVAQQPKKAEQQSTTIEHKTKSAEPKPKTSTDKASRKKETGNRVPDKRKSAKTKPIGHDSGVDMKQWNDYQLELKAASGNSQAQYVLGRRWMGKGDSARMVLGMQYLEMAARAGHREAQNFLRNHHLKKR